MSDVDAIRLRNLDRRPVGRARFAGWIVLVEARRVDVASLLQDGISLPPVAGGADTHPLVVVFGEISHTMVLVGGIWVPTGKPFQELGVYIPDARIGADAIGHLAVARIFSGSRP